MKFREEAPAKRIIQKKVTVTMRDYNYRCGANITIEIETEEHYFAKAEVIAVFRNLEVFRKLTWRMSGYDSLEEWEEKAFELSFEKRLPRYIVMIRPYFVQKVQETTTPTKELTKEEEEQFDEWVEEILAEEGKKND